ncbi:MAG TPA: cupredoxin family copper-binding protein [Ktedonobacteraceae bacterium]
MVILEKRPSIATKVWSCLLAMSFLVVLTACGGTANSPAPTPTTAPTIAPTPTPTTVPTDTPTAATTNNENSISVLNFAFTPASLTVKVGTKVTWTNNGSVTHTVTANQGAFDSGALAPGKTFSFTFTKAGTYSYHCTIHRAMIATIVVQ